MNFPETQKTGLLAEQDVERLFTSWGWVCGKDRIDIGYDLSVGPDRARFKGARFLVQVKGTAQSKKKHVSVQVSKARLREYSESVIPVFIVRVSSSGEFFWLHAQEWARTNKKRLSGNGECVIKFDLDQKLSDRDVFESYLFDVMRPLHERKGALFQLAEERTRYLSAIDDRLGVRVGLENGTEKFEIFAKSEGVESKFHFIPASRSESIEALKDAIEFGLPASVEVDSFRLEGSKLFDEIGAGGDFKGTLSIQSTSKNSGTVHFYPGDKYSIGSAELVVPADWSHGNKGIAISSSKVDGLIEVAMRLTMESGLGQANINLKLKVDELAGKPMQCHDEFASLAAWAEQVITKDAMRVELRFGYGRQTLTHARFAIQEMWTFLELVRTLGRLHLVCKVLNSNLTVRRDLHLNQEDFSDVNLAYALLRGERYAVKIGPIEIEPSEGSVVGREGEFVITTSLTFVIDNQELGTIPVFIELPSSKIEAIPESTKMRLVQVDEGVAWISYNEDGTAQGVLARREMPEP